MHPMLPSGEMSPNNSLSISECSSGDVSPSLFWDSRRHASATAAATSTESRALVSTSFTAASTETWAKRVKLANTMVPHLLANYALSRASRLCNRIQGASYTASLTQPAAIRMYDCVRYSLIALIFYGEWGMPFYASKSHDATILWASRDGPLLAKAEIPCIVFDVPNASSLAIRLIAPAPSTEGFGAGWESNSGPSHGTCEPPPSLSRLISNDGGNWRLEPRLDAPTRPLRSFKVGTADWIDLF